MFKCLPPCASFKRITTKKGRRFKRFIDHPVGLEVLIYMISAPFRSANSVLHAQPYMGSGRTDRATLHLYSWVGRRDALVLVLC